MSSESLLERAKKAAQERAEAAARERQGLVAKEREGTEQELLRRNSVHIYFEENAKYFQNLGFIVERHNTVYSTPWKHYWEVKIP